tara:strand:+ start:164 stop:937 length:774 start_codon:yes stop_codon:yes gene_type:complete
MKIIIIIEKYGGFCNRFFQSLHYHAFTIEKDIRFFNPSMLGLLKFDNNFYYFLDKVNNFLLKIISKSIKYFFRKNAVCFYFNKNNYIRFVNGWDFRKNQLTERYYNELKKIYSFKKWGLSKKAKFLVNHLDNQKKKGKFIVGIHIRRNDYKTWNNGKFYFSDQFYKDVINKVKINLKNEKKDPFFVIVSDEKIVSKIGFNLLSNGSWKEDQITLQSCDLIVGPPSTFSMWASYIAQIPLIQLTSTEYDLNNQIICEG